MLLVLDQRRVEVEMGYGLKSDLPNLIRLLSSNYS